MPKKTTGSSKLKPVRYAPLFLDWTFKKSFGTAGGEPLLMSMLNDFLKRVLPSPIRNVKYLPTELLGAAPKSKKVIFDILCEDGNGNKYLLEMQNAKLRNAGDRLRLYISRLQSEGIDKGSKSYRLPGSFFIGFLNYKRDNGRHFFTEECWFNLQRKEIASKNDFRVFIELPKFVKTAEQCKTFRDKIVFLFKNLHVIKERPKNFGEKIFDRIFSIAEISNLTGDDLKAYRYSMRYVDERKLAIECAVEDAVEEAVKETERKAFKRGKFETAKNMLKRGYPLDEIRVITNLSPKQIMALR